jgi:hypothetical protein
MANPCYSGSNPIGKLTDQERLAMWKWVKENAVDHGMPLEQVHETFNNHFFGGSAKPEWVNEFLAARKMPFKRASDAAWAAQARRRAIQQQAKHLVNGQNATNMERAFNAVVAGPRYVAVGGGVHGVVFPFTHGGALLLNPLRWKAFARMVRNTWRNISPAEAENLRDTMARNENFTLAQRNGLDLSTHGAETGGGNVSARTWNALVETRFRLWNAAMKRHINSGKYSPEEIDSIAKEMAVWANHATGSGKGPITAHPVTSSAFFGPKLTQSYWNRLIGDPVKTLATFSSWNRASAGDKAVAMQRLRGSVTAALTYTGMLYANQAMLAATGQKDKINWNDPSQSDWLGFKWGGFKWSLPGSMHAEINLIGQIVASQSMTPEQLAAAGMEISRKKSGEVAKISPNRLLSLRQQYVGRQLLSYVQNKATPVYGLGKELITGHDFMGRPLPWSSDKGTPKKPPISWGEFAWSKAPIPLSSAAGYVYDQLRKAGASVTDASMWMRAAMVGGVNATTGVDLKAVKDPTPHRTRGQAQVGH